MLQKLQEREIATLRSDLEKNVQLVKDLDRMKKEYEFLELQNEALIATLDSKEATIRDLEDNILVSYFSVQKFWSSVKGTREGLM